jgi:transcriptional activator SPT7
MFERISWVFASLVSPPSSEYRVFLSRRSFYGRKEEMGTGSSYRTWNSLAFVLPTRPLMTVSLFMPCRSKPTEPPPPFPPPPPFVPLEDRMEDEVIGLLRPFYKSRFDASCTVSSCYPKTPTSHWRHSGRRPFASQTIPAIPGQLLQPPSPFQRYHNQLSAAYTASITGSTVLPDDVPNSAQTKMDRSGRLLAGNRRTLPQRRNRRRRKTPHLPGTGGGGVPGVVNGLVGGGMNGVINMNVGNGTGVQQMTVAGLNQGTLEGLSG